MSSSQNGPALLAACPRPHLAVSGVPVVSSPEPEVWVSVAVVESMVLNSLNSSCPADGLPVRNPSTRDQAFRLTLAVLVIWGEPVPSRNWTLPLVFTLSRPHSVPVCRKASRLPFKATDGLAV